MLSFKEMIYVFAILTVCFLSCVFKTAYLLKGLYSDLVGMYIFTNFALYIGAVLMFVFLRKKCGAYEREPQRETFLAVKKLKNASELVYAAVIIFFIASFFDIFNAKFLGKVYKDFTVLFKSYPLWEVLLGSGVIIFGLKSYMRFYSTNKIFSALECKNYKDIPKSVYTVIKQYPTLEEYEKGSNIVRKPFRKSENDEQDRFLKEHEVPIEDINLRLAGLDIIGIKNGKPVYSKTNTANTGSRGRNMIACPLCGSLNPLESGECSFCGGKLEK